MVDTNAFNNLMNQFVSSFGPTANPWMNPPFPPGAMPGMGPVPGLDGSMMEGWLMWQKTALKAYLSMLESMDIDAEEQLNQMLKASAKMWLEIIGDVGKNAGNAMTQHRAMVQSMIDELDRMHKPGEGERA